MKIALHELILVTWLDAEEDNAWEDHKGIDRTVIPAQTVGFFIEEKGQLFIVARSWDEKNQNSEGRMKIMRKNIIRIDTLTLGKCLYGQKRKAK